MHLRIARPVSDLRRARVMYCQGLGLGLPGTGFHFERVVLQNAAWT